MTSVPPALRGTRRGRCLGVGASRLKHEQESQILRAPCGTSWDSTHTTSISSRKYSRFSLLSRNSLDPGRGRIYPRREIMIESPAFMHKSGRYALENLLAKQNRGNIRMVFEGGISESGRQVLDHRRLALSSTLAAILSSSLDVSRSVSPGCTLSTPSILNACSLDHSHPALTRRRITQRSR